MIITIKNNSSRESFEKLNDFLISKNITLSPIVGLNQSAYGLIGDTLPLDKSALEAFECVDSVSRITTPYKKAARSFHPEDTIIDVNGIKIGGNEIVIIAGPCSVENENQIETIAENVKKSGAKLLRGGAYKPRTSPYSFRGLEEEGLILLSKVKEKTGLPIVSEILSVKDLDLFLKYVDVIQIGARNMQNFELLKALGKINKPVLLKRGSGNTVEEWLLAAEYILLGGNNNVILCERGIRTFEKYTRNTLDLSVIPLIKKLSHLPIIIDPSHSTGKWELVEAMSLASIAAGADGLLIEVHNSPEEALSDGVQSLKLENFDKLMQKGKKIAEVINRKI